MPRYILIDNSSGYVWGDSADFATAEPAPQTPIEAARMLDEHVSPGIKRDYEECHQQSLASNETGYHVYRADINGSEAVPVVYDGQDRETIDSVTRDCLYVTSIRASHMPEA